MLSEEQIKQPIVLVTQPEVHLLAQPQLVHAGVMGLAHWIKTHRPECVPEQGFVDVHDLLPHDRYDVPHEAPTRFGERYLSDAELLVEVAGRKCYDSFAERAGKKTNAGYTRHLLGLDDDRERTHDAHVSVFYHTHFTFAFVGVSRKFSHQFIRNYVGHAREEEGAPSQESTRYTHHYGHYVVPPYILAVQDPKRRAGLLEDFRAESQANAEAYRRFVKRELETVAAEAADGRVPTSKKKEVMESAAGLLTMSAETSFVWTSNPIALTKVMVERGSPHADAEMQRFVRVLAPVCFSVAANLFQDPRLDFLR